MHACKQAASCLERGLLRTLTANIDTGLVAFQHVKYMCVKCWRVKANMCFLVHDVDT